jgi:DHA1 family multidrug resistance protein-like MFS transporter
MLFAARALSGVLVSAALSTAMAYIGDSTADEERGGGMGVLGAAAGLGTILGPGLGGWLGGGSLSTPFFIGAGLSLVALLLVALLLPETLPREARAAVAGKLALVNFRGLWQALFDVNLEYPYVSGAVILGVVFALSLAWLAPAWTGPAAIPSHPPAK